MKKINHIIPGIISLLALLGGLFIGCKKENTLVDVPSQAHFVGNRNQSYSITSATPAPYKITVGTTDVSSSDRTVTFKIVSSTGAVAGTHYTLSGVSGSTVVIPAGKATADISVQGIFAPYNGTGRKDSLMFVLSSPSIDPAKFSDTVKLLLRGPCFEGDLVLADFLGAYKNTVETFGSNPAYGPYTTTISAVNQLTPTTGTVTVTNIWDNGWSPITFTLDWTNPANRTATVVAQSAIGGSDAGDLSSTYAGQTVAVRPFAGNAGTFSWCGNTLTLRMQLGVTGVGFFGLLYTVNMAR
jgi:hypothetical protein